MFFQNSLAKIHEDNAGKVSDKWEKFIQVYERLLGPLRSQDIKLLEIGVQNGGSLETWCKYFKSAKLILGCDIDPRCGALKFSDDRVKLIVGDATQPQVQQVVRGFSANFDLIIDDGSHRSSDVLAAFCLYFPMLSPGGIFIVEDTHTLYWKNYGGGLRRGDSAKEFFKDLTDVINYEHWHVEGGIESFIQDRFDLQDASFIAQGWVESVEFHNSLIIIRKALEPSHRKLGRRLITGEVAIVNPEPLSLRRSLAQDQ